MILTGNEIKKQYLTRRLTIEPYDENCINPNSYDLHIGNQLLVYSENVLDPRKNNKSTLITIPDTGILLEGGKFYLAATVEKIGSDHYVPILHAKSGTARMGLFVHVTADLIDIGSHGNLTLQLAPVVNVWIFPNTRIAQATFWKPEGDIDLYKGKYSNSIGPQASKSYVDFITGFSDEK